MPAITKPNQYFDINLYSGNSGTQTITNSGLFQPDFVWSKCRNVGRSHRLCNSVGGSTREMYSDVTDAEENNGSMTSFTSTGFNLNNATASAYNASGENYVSWQWKAGGTAVTNTAGSITSQVSANPTAGFSVVTYTGTGSSGSVGHGLGAVPSVILIKARSSTTAWRMYQANLGITKYLVLNTTAAEATASMWGSPTDTAFVIGGTTYEVNETGVTYVAYCFAPVAGYSAFGSYTGNGSTDGPFVFTNFKPKFIMVKPSSTTGEWTMWDSSRDTYNVGDKRLAGDDSASEYNNGNGLIDFLSNGFKPRVNHISNNSSGVTYIYMAIAEAPFKYASAR
jgi:hypothetical protein